MNNVFNFEMGNNMKIDFHFKKIFPLRNRLKIKSLIKRIIDENGKRGNSIDIIFCSDPYLLMINKKFLNHNTYTDIITFNLGLEGEISGEIYISIDRVRENARKFNVTQQNELCRVIIHGILHLIGLDDKTIKEKVLMRSKEDYYLSFLNSST